MLFLPYILFSDTSNDLMIGQSLKASLGQIYALRSGTVSLMVMHWSEIGPLSLMAVSTSQSVMSLFAHNNLSQLSGSAVLKAL